MICTNIVQKFVMKNMSAVAFLLLFFLQLHGQQNPNPNPNLDSFIEEEMEYERLPGVATVIVKDGKIVWLKSYGFADVQNNIATSDSTSFLLASISKVFVATAMMQLIEQNLCSLDDDINTHLPFQFGIPQHPNAQVTPRQLMTHTASIQDNYNVMDTYYDFPDPSISLSDCIERYFSVDGVDYNPTTNFLPNAPGTLFEYSNIGTALQGYLVERISNQPFDQYCQEHIFSKLCMDNSAWFLADMDSNNVARPYQFTGGNFVPYPHYGFADYPSGQLRSSILDMANFMIAYLNGGNFGGTTILSSNSIEQMLTPQVPNLESGQGLNWYQEEIYHSGGETWLWGHNGGEQGASTDFYIDPVNKIGICVLTNGEGDALYICDELYDFALTLNPNSGYSPACLTASLEINVTNPEERTLIKIVDILGREINEPLNTPFIKIFSDGTSEKCFVVGD